MLRVGGEVDIGSAQELRTALTKALDNDPTVVVDLGEVSFIDASGLRAILHTADSLNGARPLVLVNASRLAWLLELVGLEDLPSIVIRGEGDVRGR